MLTAELGFISENLSLSLALLFSIGAYTEMPASSDADHINKLLKGLKGGMNIHMGDLRGEEMQKPDRGVSSQAPVSLNDSNTNPFRSLRAHQGEKHLHTNTNMPPPHTHMHRGLQHLISIIPLHWSKIHHCECAAIDWKYISKLSSETKNCNP